MGSLLASLAEQFDVVIIDTPALLAVSDGANLVSLVDVVLLVAREGHSTRQGVTGAREQLEAVQAENIGVVINRSRATPNDYYSAYQKQRAALEPGALLEGEIHCNRTGRGPPQASRER